MSSATSCRLGLLVRSGAFDHRTARSEVDLALAASALDFNLEVFFLGASVLQLVRERDASCALLPGGHRAWAALPDFSPALIYAEQDWLDRCRAESLSLVLPVTGLSSTEFQKHWRRCNHVLVV
jgi:sulfur relay (sulfurtransferase) DsrF/TusC family protein